MKIPPTLTGHLRNYLENSLSPHEREERGKDGGVAVPLSGDRWAKPGLWFLLTIAFAKPEQAEEYPAAATNSLTISSRIVSAIWGRACKYCPWNPTGGPGILEMTLKKRAALSRFGVSGKGATNYLPSLSSCVLGACKTLKIPLFGWRHVLEEEWVFSESPDTSREMDTGMRNVKQKPDPGRILSVDHYDSSWRIERTANRIEARFNYRTRNEWGTVIMSCCITYGIRICCLQMRILPSWGLLKLIDRPTSCATQGIGSIYRAKFGKQLPKVSQIFQFCCCTTWMVGFDL